jgi:purine nucleosidase
MRRLLALTAAVLAGICGAPVAAAAAPPPAVIVDTDMDFDDAAALAYLVQADRLGMIDLRAVTVAGDGVAFPGAGLGHARCLLDKLGMAHIPTSDGVDTRPNNFPVLILEWLDAVVQRAVRLAPEIACPHAQIEGRAPQLIADTIHAADRPVTVITLGPVTNLADALARDPGIAAGIERVIVEGGDTTERPPEHPDDTHDYNLWVNAPAAQSVLDALRERVWMSGKNATDHVPLSAAFRLRLAADRTTTAAEVVYTVASDPLIMAGEQGLASWWDPLAAVAATVGGVERFELTRIRVRESADDEGRTVVDPAGARVHFGVSADADRFHQTFLDVLNHRPAH